MKKLLLITLVYFGLIAIGQDNLDSLLNVDFSKRTLRQNVNTYMNISREYYILGDYENGTLWGKKILKNIDKLDNDTLIGQAAFYIGLNYSPINRDSAFKYYRLSVDKLMPLKHDWTTYALNNLCLEYTEVGWYPEALKLRIQSLEYYNQLKDTALIIHTKVKIGYIHDRIGDFEKALKYYNEVYPLALLYNDSNFIVDVYANKGIAFDELKQFDSAHYYNQLAISYFLALDEMYSYRMWCSNIGNTYLKQGNFDEAKVYLLKSIDTVEIDDEGETIKLINLSKVYYHEGNYLMGDSLLLRAIDLGKLNGQYKFLAEAFYTLSESYEQRNDSRFALEYYKIYKAYEDTNFNEIKSNQIAYHDALFENEQKENLLLQAKNKNQEIANEKLGVDLKLAQRNIFLLVLLGVLVFGGILFIWLFQRNRRKLLQDKQNAIIEEKDRGINAVITAQENERGRIAKELHDGIVQELTLIKNQVSPLIDQVDSTIGKNLEKVVFEIQKSASEVRNISHQLMPLALRELGLVAALEDMIQKNFSNSDIQYDLEIIGMEERLPEKVEVSLYRIAQELTNNIIKHSKATSVMYMLTKRNEQVVFVVEDNGVGLNEIENSGIGFSSISSRVSMIHGEFKYENGVERGLISIVKIPLN
ncbi:MAG: hypothetical protein H6598_06240 [Flavobacteriales bacterium]|nr:hypothetical protein [Flavobacteriales bacterium]